MLRIESINPSFPNAAALEVPDRYVVTFRDNDEGAGLKLLRKEAGLCDFVHSRDYKEQCLCPDSANSRDGAVFDDLNICSVNCSQSIAERISVLATSSSILAVEPEYEVQAIGTTTSPQRDPHFIDSSNTTWGLTATNYHKPSQFTGRGINIAILDTGIDAAHPDFQEVKLVRQQSFRSDVELLDRNGHGTHCLGIVAARKQPDSAPTYSLATGVSVFAAKVLDDEGNGDVRGILAGMNWAIAHRCEVIALSLGASFKSSTVMFEEVGRRALDAGTLVVAAAGNNANRGDRDYGFVVRPANSRSIMAVGAVDRLIRPANFSSRSSVVTGGEVDIVAPGVEVFSSWPGAERYKSLSGTSMAVPFVVGAAAIHSEATGARGRDLWKSLVESASSLPHPTVDVGAGLLQSL